MNILLLGSSGLIGAAVHAKLRATAHTVIAPTSVELDFQCPDTWAAWLLQADALVNCVGVMSADSGLMQSVQYTAPQALYQQAQDKGVGYVLQVSALGADAHAKTVFFAQQRRIGCMVAGKRPERGYRASQFGVFQNRTQQSLVCELGQAATPVVA